MASFLLSLCKAHQKFRRTATPSGEKGLIVITDTDDYNSYIVPRPGVRINLADLTDANFPFYSLIYGINDNGDMIGVGGGFPYCACQAFLLQRVPGALAAAPRPAVKATANDPRR